MGGRLFTGKLVFGGCKFTAFGRLTVPHQLLLLNLPTLVARRKWLAARQCHPILFYLPGSYKVLVVAVTCLGSQ
jgi:hypothetical protein